MCNTAFGKPYTAQNICNICLQLKQPRLSSGQPIQKRFYLKTSVKQYCMVILTRGFFSKLLCLYPTCLLRGCSYQFKTNFTYIPNGDT